jgi:SAM-dependent methyltransferase
MMDLGSAAAPIEGILALYTELALHPGKDFGWGKGRENARRLGYDARWLDAVPERLALVLPQPRLGGDALAGAQAVWESAAAVGNPFGLGRIEPGMTVVDLCCGAGLDLCIAAALVGKRDRAVGIDLTPAMASKAEEAARLMGLSNVEVRLGDMKAVPLGDGCARHRDLKRRHQSLACQAVRVRGGFPPLEAERALLVC